MGPERDLLSHEEVLARYLGAFVDQLVAEGLQDVCLCPGSRSTPLALMFARHPAVKLWTHLDERSCAYFALGMARERRHPVAILCSSGTAAVNFAPAVVEAYHSRVPLLVLTADRPPELQELGANQVIDQTKLYGTAVKRYIPMMLPEGHDQAIRWSKTAATRAVQAAYAWPAGPVHLNFPFREPLVPAPYEFRETKADWWRLVETPQFDDGERTAERLSGYERGVVVYGPGAEAWVNDESDIARLLGWPAIAEPLSGARDREVGSTNHLIAGYDAFLRIPEVMDRLKPDIILRFGDPPTGRALSNFLQRHRDAWQVLVGPSERWPDPELSADVVIDTHPLNFLTAVAEHLEQREPGAWLRTWQDVEANTQAATARVIEQDGTLSEPSVITGLVAVVPEAFTVFCGNSMPVRDIDSFWPAGNRAVDFAGNRGASGIDGVVSTALGAASVENVNVVLVIGDLSFYHDMNGLLAARRHNLSATIVLVNNDGGGIFSFLPQHADQTHFETLFGTPHGLDFSAVAQIYGVDFQRVSTREEYRAALQASFFAPGVQIIEVHTEREANLKLHNDIWSAVAEALQPGSVK